jgi:hypothetical protein
METKRIIIIVGLLFLTYSVIVILYNYIQSKIKSEEFTLEKKDKYYLISFVIALVLGFLFFQKEDVLLGLKAGLIISSFSGILFLIIHIIFRITGTSYKKRQNIKTVDKKGFTITSGTKQKNYYWRDVQWVKFEREKFKLIIKEKSRLEIDLKTDNLYYLLRNIPLGYKDFDYTFMTDFFSKLTTCKVCGFIALKETECLSCGCTTWTTELEKNYANYEEYVKENQLDIFATMEKDERFNEFKIPNKNFDFDAKWKPIVTKNEVLEYSEKEYWEKE